MMRVSLNTAKFLKDMNNIVLYSEGFLEGVQKGKNIFLKNIGLGTKELLEKFIDANARTNPQMLQHMYEWYRSGSPESRLFNIDYTVSNIGLSFYASFRQSSTVKDGSSVPFYDKARIMEQGIPVRIEPLRSNVLVFEDNGETVFTKKPVTVRNPGGTQAQGGFQKTFDLFFSKYFTQAFLKTSGVDRYLKNPVAYKRNLPQGRRAGKAKGISTGYSWIANAGVVR
jgi:hypothetical protein